MTKPVPCRECGEIPEPKWFGIDFWVIGCDTPGCMNLKIYFGDTEGDVVGFWNKENS